MPPVGVFDRDRLSPEDGYVAETIKSGTSISERTAEPVAVDGGESNEGPDVWCPEETTIGQGPAEEGFGNGAGCIEEKVIQQSGAQLPELNDAEPCHFWQGYPE